MGSTNKTTNYELSQYIGTDKPSWLNDYNNDMLKIDTQMKANATAAGNAQSTATAADGKADANTESISTLNNQINTPSTGLAAIVADHTTAIIDINSTIGNTPLTTTAQTLTGAIEEVKGSIPAIPSSLLQFIGIHDETVTADGVKTFSTLLDEVYLAFKTWLISQTNKFRFVIELISCDSHVFKPEDTRFQGTSFNINVDLNSLNVSSTEVMQARVSFVASGSRYYESINGTPTDKSSSVPANGSVIRFRVNTYELS